MTQRSAHCLNCGAPTPDEFCSHCGQKNADYREGLRELVSEVAQELFQFDSRIGHTIVPFLFQPGKLTAEWVAGKRTHYSAPLRIFLLASVAYFFALSMTSHGHVDVQIGKHGVSVNIVDVPDGGAPDAGVDTREEDPSGEVDEGPSVMWRLRHSRFAAKEAETPKERADRVVAFMLSAAPKAVFVLMPLFALMLQALFFRARRYYVEHLVFAVHLHSFVFVLLLVALLPLPFFWPFVALALAYLAIGLRRVYRPTILQLAWKLFVLVLLYTILIACIIAAVAIAAVGLS